MSYFDSRTKKWVGEYRDREHRKTKSFKTRRDAKKWEASYSALHKTRETIPVECAIIPGSIDEFKGKYRVMYSDPNNIAPDIIDCLMADIGLPIRFKNLKELLKQCESKRRSIPVTLRAKILKRDNFTCRWCGRRPPEVKIHVDHIIPRSRGGLTEERNLQTLCEDCNHGKSDRLAG